MIVEKKTDKFFQKYELPRGTHILAGCSGGIDSTVLLHNLACRQARGEFLVSCAYFDHGIRHKSETDADIDFLKRVTESLRVPFYCERLEEGSLLKLARQYKGSLEEIAREKRYAYLINLRQEIKADYIALGHTLDDNCETLVMNFLQGAGVWGLCGIPEKRNELIRPLSFCTREEILEYLNHYNLSYREDITNSTGDYLRNRVRLSLLPVIKQIFPGYKTALQQLFRKMSLTRELLDDELARRISWQKVTAAPENETYRINAIDFFANPGIIRLYSLYTMFDVLEKQEKKSFQKRIPYRFLAPLVEGGAGINTGILLKGLGFRFYIKGDNLFFERDIVDTGKKGYFIFVDEQQKNHIIGDKIITYKVLAGNAEMNKENALLINLDFTTPPLIIRSKRAGDKIRIKSGAKSIKKLYNEWSVPSGERWKIPVVTDKKNILGIAGKPFGYKNRLNVTTEAVNKKVNTTSKFLRVEAN